MGIRRWLIRGYAGRGPVSVTTKQRRSGAVARALHTPYVVAAAALAVHAVWIAVYFAAGHEARDFSKLGYRFVRQSHASRVIVYDPSYRYPPNHDAPDGTGYDGQFAYYMAVDFRRARFYMDDPAYRYSRVLYPVVARTVALGEVDAVPATMILVNWLAIGGEL